MPIWLSLAKGPVFTFIFLLLVLGLSRLFLLTLWDIFVAVRRAGDRRLPYWKLVRQTISWLLPFNKLHRNRAGYSLASFSIHVGILIVSFFLRNHLDIVEANIGLSWFAISKPVLDALTLVAIVGMSILLLYRLYVKGSRRLSSTADYFLLLNLLGIFMAGFVAGRPWNPIPYDSLMLFHTLSGMLLLCLIPFSKIAHCVLFPLIRLGTEVAWHFTPQGGSETVKSLHGPEGRKI